ncbi:MAG TPA: TlpA disulfide reductase family protein [Bryobacteraceae bacterium]|nr:TlpA disulfide reductase family protein [Bryobacteraceae bacterium]
MAIWKRRKLLEAGVRAPEFQLGLLTGGETSLHTITAAGPAVCVFFKISCPVCQFTLPFLERIHAAGALSVYGISQNGPEDTRDFCQRYGVTFPMLLDREESGFPVSNAFGISSVPTIFLVEAAGTVSHVIEGWRKSEVEWLSGKAGVRTIRQEDHVPEWKAG